MTSQKHGLENGICKYHDFSMESVSPGESTIIEFSHIAKYSHFLIHPSFSPKLSSPALCLATKGVCFRIKAELTH